MPGPKKTAVSIQPGTDFIFIRNLTDTSPLDETKVPYNGTYLQKITLAELEEVSVHFVRERPSLNNMQPRVIYIDLEYNYQYLTDKQTTKHKPEEPSSTIERELIEGKLLTKLIDEPRKKFTENLQKLKEMYDKAFKKEREENNPDRPKNNTPQNEETSSKNNKKMPPESKRLEIQIQKYKQKLNKLNQYEESIRIHQKKASGILINTESGAEKEFYSINLSSLQYEKTAEIKIDLSDPTIIATKRCLNALLNAIQYRQHTQPLPKEKKTTRKRIITGLNHSLKNYHLLKKLNGDAKSMTDHLNDFTIYYKVDHPGTVYIKNKKDNNKLPFISGGNTISTRSLDESKELRVCMVSCIDGGSVFGVFKHGNDNNTTDQAINHIEQGYVLATHSLSIRKELSPINAIKYTENNHPHPYEIDAETLFLQLLNQFKLFNKPVHIDFHLPITDYFFGMYAKVLGNQIKWDTFTAYLRDTLKRKLNFSNRLYRLFKDSGIQGSFNIGSPFDSLIDKNKFENIEKEKETVTAGTPLYAQWLNKYFNQLHQQFEIKINLDKLDELNKIYNPDPTQYDNYNNYLARLKEELKNSGGSSSESNHIKKRSTYPEKKLKPTILKRTISKLLENLSNIDFGANHPATLHRNHHESPYFSSSGTALVRILVEDAVCRKIISDLKQHESSTKAPWAKLFEKLDKKSFINFEDLFACANIYNIIKADLEEEKTTPIFALFPDTETPIIAHIRKNYSIESLSAITYTPKLINTIITPNDEKTAIDLLFQKTTIVIENKKPCEKIIKNRKIKDSKSEFIIYLYPSPLDQKSKKTDNQLGNTYQCAYYIPHQEKNVVYKPIQFNKESLDEIRGFLQSSSTSHHVSEQLKLEAIIKSKYHLDIGAVSINNLFRFDTLSYTIDENELRKQLAKSTAIEEYLNHLIEVPYHPEEENNAEPAAHFINKVNKSRDVTGPLKPLIKNSPLTSLNFSDNEDDESDEEKIEQMTGVNTSPSKKIPPSKKNKKWQSVKLNTNLINDETGDVKPSSSPPTTTPSNSALQTDADQNTTSNTLSTGNKFKNKISSKQEKQKLYVTTVQTHIIIQESNFDSYPHKQTEKTSNLLSSKGKGWGRRLFGARSRSPSPVDNREESTWSIEMDVLSAEINPSNAEHLTKQNTPSNKTNQDSTETSSLVLVNA